MTASQTIILSFILGVAVIIGLLVRRLRYLERFLRGIPTTTLRIAGKKHEQIFETLSMTDLQEKLYYFRILFGIDFVFTGRVLSTEKSVEIQILHVGGFADNREVDKSIG
jgi:hypothetical protein